MKKLLFVIPSLEVGGAEKALINLVQVLEAEYQIDVIVFRKSGLFLEQVPSTVPVHEPSGQYGGFVASVPKSLVKLLLKGRIRLLFSRIMYSAVLNMAPNKGQGEQKGWKFLRAAIPRNEHVYDVAIGFLEKSSIYYVVDRVSAKKKIGWIHNDYRAFNLDSKFDEKYFSKLDQLISVSPECADILRNCFPNIDTPIDVVHNITSKHFIKGQLKGRENPFNDNFFNIVSVGRLDTQKGYDLGIEAISSLPNKVKSNLKWYIVGEGPERKPLEELIKKYGLSDQIILLGQKPFPSHYVNFADIYFQPSRYEGKSIAIDEAKLLGKVILATNFHTVKDQLTHGKNGWIVDMDVESIAEGISHLHSHPELREEIGRSLESFTINIDDEIRALKNIIHG